MKGKNFYEWYEKRDWEFVIGNLGLKFRMYGKLKSAL
jgi:hypothetical protein